MSNRRSDGRKFGDVGRALQEELNRLGITGYSFGKRKHGYVEFSYRGAEYKLTFACSPRIGATAARNSVSQLRRMVGA